MVRGLRASQFSLMRIATYKVQGVLPENLLIFDSLPDTFTSFVAIFVTLLWALTLANNSDGFVWRLVLKQFLVSLGFSHSLEMALFCLHGSGPLTRAPDSW